MIVYDLYAPLIAVKILAALDSAMKKESNYFFSFIAILAIAFTVSTSFAQEINLLTHSVGEQTYIDNKGNLRGKKGAGRRAFNIELVRQISIIVDNPLSMKIVPFKRGFQMVQTELNFALFNVNLTSERKDTAKWVGPIQSSITYFYESKKVPTGIQNMEDAKKVEYICVLRGNVHHDWLEKNGFKNLHLVSSYLQCLKMLANNRVALTPLSNISSLVKSKEFKDLIQPTPVKLTEMSGYIAFSKNVPDETIEKWQDILDHIKVTGLYGQLKKKYLSQ